MDAQQQVVVELAGLVLSDVAPEELPELPEVADEFFAAPQRTIGSRRDEALGFGVELALVAPYVLALATPVVTYLGGIVADGIKDAAIPIVADRTRRLLRRRRPSPPAALPPGVPALAPGQAREIRDQTRRYAQSLGLPPAQAEMLADALVGRLVVGG
jgi:hypothetical protein